MGPEARLPMATAGKFLVVTAVLLPVVSVKWRPALRAEALVAFRQLSGVAAARPLAGVVGTQLPAGGTLLVVAER